MSSTRPSKRPNAKPAPAKVRQVPPTSARAAPEKISNVDKNADEKPPRKNPRNAGIGRVKGVPNKVTRTTREIFQAFVDGKAERADELWERVAKKNPAKALSLLAKLAEFVLPKLQRTELSGELNHRGQLPYTGAVTEVVSAIEAARVYQEVMMGKRDGRSVKFVNAPPRPEPAAPPPPPPRPKAEVLRPAGLPLPEDVPHGTRAQDVEDAELLPGPSAEVIAADAALCKQRAPQVVT